MPSATEQSTRIASLLEQLQPQLPSSHGSRERAAHLLSFFFGAELSQVHGIQPHLSLSSEQRLLLWASAIKLEHLFGDDVVHALRPHIGK